MIDILTVIEYASWDMFGWISYNTFSVGQFLWRAYNTVGWSQHTIETLSKQKFSLADYPPEERNEPAYDFNGIERYRTLPCSLLKKGLIQDQTITEIGTHVFELLDRSADSRTYAFVVGKFVSSLCFWLAIPKEGRSFFSFVVRSYGCEFISQKVQAFVESVLLQYDLNNLLNPLSDKSLTDIKQLIEVENASGMYGYKAYHRRILTELYLRVIPLVADCAK